MTWVQFSVHVLMSQITHTETDKIRNFSWLKSVTLNIQSWQEIKDASELIFKDVFAFTGDQWPVSSNWDIPPQAPCPHWYTPLCSGCHSAYVLQALFYDISTNLLIYLEMCIPTIFLKFYFCFSCCFLYSYYNRLWLETVFFGTLYYHSLFYLKMHCAGELSTDSRCFQRWTAARGRHKASLYFSASIYHHATHEFFDPAL